MKSLIQFLDDINLSLVPLIYGSQSTLWKYIVNRRKKKTEHYIQEWSLRLSVK